MTCESGQGQESEACTGAGERLTSNELAALIIDALLRPGIVEAEDVDRAIEIATEEINVRKALGDY